MTPLSLAVLGPFQASLGDESLTNFRTSKVQALLVYLAIEQEPQTRSSILDLLWPGMPERSAQSNLRQILYYTRKLIPSLSEKDVPGSSGVPLYITNRQTIQLNPAANVKLDTNQFEALIAGTQTHHHPEMFKCNQCHKELERAVKIYRGDFLVDFYLEDSNVYEDWAHDRREYFRRRVIDALEILTTINLHQRKFSEAKVFAERQIDIDNFRESAYQQLMETLALSGFKEDAMGVYEQCRRLLAEELAMEPSARTTEIYNKIRAGNLEFDAPMDRGVKGYELKEEIGQGAYGAVHRAIQPAIGREVAIKVIRRKYADDPAFIRRFEAEAQTIARLEHPYIVPLYDYWRDPNGAYLVMRYVKAGSLLTSLEKGPWDIEPTVRMLDQVASALTTAHKQGIIHRDIKPANILLDEAGNAYLSDFGIAKDLSSEENLTATGSIMGTLDYISPEQIRNDPVDPQSDIYSLGAVLYEMLTGEKPYSDASMANLIFKHLNTPVPLVVSSRPDIPNQVDTVIQKATAKNPGDRYSDSLEMAEAFREAVHGLPTFETSFVSTAIPAGIELINPYKGLRAFQEADEDDFFGRESLVERLIGRLNESHFLAIVGPSGSGKSSAVKAGLIPALRGDAISGSEKWFFAEMTPGSHPLEELEQALLPVAVDPPPNLVEPMSRDERGILRTIRRILPDEEGAELLLVIDQFEELYTLVTDQNLRNLFINSILAAINAPHSPIRVVITLRADFYDRPLSYQPMGRMLKENTEVVIPMTPEELSWAIQQPAQRMGITIEENVVTAIVAEAAEQAGALPLVQYAMTELFDNRQGHRITHAAYQESGGVLGALSQRAEAIYTELEDSGKEAARQLFLRLVTLGEGVEDTRRRVLRTELEALGTHIDTRDTQDNGERYVGGSSIVENLSLIINNFGEARLLTFDYDPATRGPTVEVAHEALLREWSRLRGWLDQSRADVRIQRILSGSAAEWLESGQDEGFLLQGARLDQFAGWAAGSDLVLTVDETNFLKASISANEMRLKEEGERRQQELETARQLAATERARAEDQAQAATSLRRRAIFLAGALSVALILALVAFFFASQSNQNATIAERNGALALTREVEALAEVEQRATAQAQAEEERRRADEQRNIALAAEADAQNEAQIRATAEAVAILEQRTAEEQRELAEQQAVLAYSRELSAEARNLLSGGYSGERPAAMALQSLQFRYSPEAQVALYQALQNGFVRHRLVGHNPSVWYLDYSPDGKWILSGGDDDELRLWDTENGEEIRQFVGHQGGVGGVISPSGLLVASIGNSDLTIRLWNALTGEELWQTDGHTDLINDVMFSPDGQTILTTSDDQTARLWDTTDGELLQTYAGHEGWVLFADFSSDGQRFITGGQDMTAREWDVVSGEILQTFQHNPEDGLQVQTVLYSPDEQYVLTVPIGQSATLWDRKSAQIIQQFTAPPGVIIVTADFSPDGRYLLTGHDDNSAVLWDVSTGEVVRSYRDQGGNILSVAFSPDGRQIATAGEDGVVRLWDIQLDMEPERINGLSGRPMGIAYTPSGNHLFIIDDAGIGRIWDFENGEFIRQFSAQTDGGFSIDISPDGQLVATGDPFRGHIWDINTGEELIQLPHESGIRTITFALDGKTIYSGGFNGSGLLWDVNTGEVVQEFSGHSAEISSVVFDENAQQLLTGSWDGTARLWDLATGEEMDVFDHGSSLGGALFLPTGDRILTSGNDGLAKIWNLDNGLIEKEIEIPSSTFTKSKISPDGARLLVGASDGTVSSFDLDSGEEVSRHSNHTDLVFDMAYSPDGKQIATASWDGTVGIWQANLEDLVDFICLNLPGESSLEDDEFSDLVGDSPICPWLE